MRWLGTLVIAATLVRAADATMVSEVHYVMGTYFHITAAHPDATAARLALRRCFTTARDAEARFSRFDATSELSRLNASIATDVPISAEMAALLQRAIVLRAQTGGSFDVGVGSVTALWRDAIRWPSPSQIAAARHGAVALAPDADVVQRSPGTVLDFDGIAKGWVVDGCVAQLRGAGITRGFLSFGESSLYAFGAPAWRVTLRGLDEHAALGSLLLYDQAVSVSSVFGHHRALGGRLVGHIVDPRTSKPLSTAAMAVVIAASATDAEAWSKALLIQAAGGGGAWRSPGAPVTGALLVRPHSVRRVGQIAFNRFSRARRIVAAAEPLR